MRYLLALASVCLLFSLTACEDPELVETPVDPDFTLNATYQGGEIVYSDAPDSVVSLAQSTNRAAEGSVLFQHVFLPADQASANFAFPRFEILVNVPNYDAENSDEFFTTAFSTGSVFPLRDTDDNVRGAELRYYVDDTTQYLTSYSLQDTITEAYFRIDSVLQTKTSATDPNVVLEQWVQVSFRGRFNDELSNQFDTIPFIEGSGLVRFRQPAD